jgi:hypothetical protein
MSKEKTTEITLEQATEAVALKKDEFKAAKAELRAFRKEKSLKPDDVPGEEKVIKALGKLEKKLENAEKAYDEAKAVLKGMKPSNTRKSSYDFPEDCVTAADKKKYRAKIRREKKAALKAEAKGEAPEEPTKKVKKSKVTAGEGEAPAEAPAEVSLKKKKKVEADED